MERGELTRVDNPEVPRLARLYDVTPRRRLRAHDLRATFVTLALAAGASEQWVSDRTGHTSSEMLQRYRRAARTAAELEMGEGLGPMHRLIPEIDSSGGKPVDLSSSTRRAEVEKVSGEGGIRTLGTVAGTHDFQAQPGAPSGPSPEETGGLSPEGEARRQAIDSLLSTLRGALEQARALDLAGVASLLVRAEGRVPR